MKEDRIKANLTDTLKVLVVDKSSFLREFVIEAFNKDDELRVVGYCKDGDEVCPFLEKQLVDVVLMDLDMPRMNGAEATKLVRTNFPNVKVVAYASHHTNERRNQMLKAGVEGYVFKSTPVRLLVEVVKNVGYPYREVQNPYDNPLLSKYFLIESQDNSIH